MEGEQIETFHNCKKCDNVDNDQMVMCDKCDKWYHYDCVGVDSNVADFSWNCDLCESPSTAIAPNQTEGITKLPRSSSSPITALPTSTKSIMVTSTGFPLTNVSLPTNPIPSSLPIVSTIAAQDFKPIASSVLTASANAVGMFHEQAAFNTALPSYITRPTTTPFIIQHEPVETNPKVDNFETQKMLQLQRLDEERKIQQKNI